MKAFGSTPTTAVAPRKFEISSVDYGTALGAGVPAREPRVDVVRVVDNFRAVLAERPDAGFASILPLIFRLKGKPYDILDGHFLFEHEFVIHGMPRRQIDKAGRQVGKSQSKAAGGILRAAARPYFNILTVTPLFEQIRKFSNNYVKPLLRESAVRSYLLAQGSDQQVLQRTLSNGSTLFYNYASNSADRIRGTSVDEMDCLRQGTPVRLADGTRVTVEQLRHGDRVASLDANGTTDDEVVDVVLQGRKPLWRITLSNGHSLEVTDNEMLATDSGWCYLADLAAAAAHLGDPVRRRWNAIQAPDRAGITNDQLHVLWGRPTCVEQSDDDPLADLRRPGLLCLAALHAGSAAAGRVQPAEEGVAADTPAQRPLRSVEIVSIAYAGEDDVYDVILARNHVFFAGDGDVLVHNCDELQDFHLDVLPVIQSCLDASPLKLERYSGTPKTFDNPLQVYWDYSSQGIWRIPCQETGCKFENVCTVESNGGHLLKMIGDGRRRKDGRLNTLLCAKCGEPLNARLGYFVHGAPSRRLTFAGFHKPQILFPMHYESALAWDKIMDVAKNKPKYLFYNEILGESFDTGQKLITLKDLAAAGTAEYRPPSRFNRESYLMTAVGADWGGKGKEKVSDAEEFISNTCFALGGIRGDGVVEITWGYQTPYIADHFQEAGMLREAAATAQVDFIAHDYGGAGDVRESILVRSGWPVGRILPFTYVSMATTKNIVTYAPVAGAARQSYSLDKARSLLLLCELIKAKKVVFPRFEGRMAELMQDFLSIYAEKRDNPRGGSSTLVNRISKRHDDFVHAVNYVVMGLFHRTQKWPNMGVIWDEIMAMRLVGADGTEESLKPGLWLPADVR